MHNERSHTGGSTEAGRRLVVARTLAQALVIAAGLAGLGQLQMLVAGRQPRNEFSDVADDLFYYRVFMIAACVGIVLVVTISYVYIGRRSRRPVHHKTTVPFMVSFVLGLLLYPVLVEALIIVWNDRHPL